MRLCALLSGGKDSVYAMYIAQQYGWEIPCAASILSENEDSYMYHTPNIGLTDAVADALDIPLITGVTKGEEEIELDALRDVLNEAKRYGIEGAVTGAVASDYQWSRINRVCYELGLKCFSPLWRKDQAMLLLDIISSGFNVLIVGAYAEGLGEEYLGREIDIETFKELTTPCRKYCINPSGEGGEYETLVIDGPNFKKRMIIEDWGKVWNVNSGKFFVRRYHLVEKVGEKVGTE